MQTLTMMDKAFFLIYQWLENHHLTRIFEENKKSLESKICKFIDKTCLKICPKLHLSRNVTWVSVNQKNEFVQANYR